MTEIERRFRVGTVPGLENAERVPIDQGYLAVDDETEVRVRRAGDEYRLTVKRGHGDRREEVEIELSEEDFGRLWSLSADRRLAKTRFLVPLDDGLVAEVDVYGGDLDGLRTAEVEFSDAGAEGDFEPPDWFGEELTGDPRYANQSLAKDGLPPEDRTGSGGEAEHEGAARARECDAAR